LTLDYDTVYSYATSILYLYYVYGILIITETS